MKTLPTNSFIGKKSFVLNLLIVQSLRLWVETRQPYLGII